MDFLLNFQKKDIQVSIKCKNQTHYKEIRERYINKGYKEKKIYYR